ALEPRTEETAGKRSQMATYQDLLRTAADEDAFEALATTIPLRVEPDTGAAKELGPPGLYRRLADSPDSEHLLVYRLRRPFSFRGSVPVLRAQRRGVVGHGRAGARRRRPTGQR